MEVSFEDPAALVHLKPGVGIKPKVGTGSGDAPPRSIVMADEWESELVRTTDNRWGDLAHPAHDGPLPVELRDLMFRLESADEDGLELGWESGGHGDAGWERSVATFGPYWEGVGPVQSGSKPPETAWRPLTFSRSLGIEKDQIHERALVVQHPSNEG